MKPSLPHILLRGFSSLCLLWLGIYWIWLVRPVDQSWYDLPLGVLCLLMAVWDIFDVVRSLCRRKRWQKEEDRP